MKPKSISALIFEVANLDTTLAFYEKLGFRVDKNDGQVALVYLNWFSMEFHLVSDTTTDTKDGPIVLISVAVDDYYQGILDAGISVDGPPRKTINGRREFRAVDPNGYTLLFFEKK